MSSHDLIQFAFSVTNTVTTAESIAGGPEDAIDASAFVGDLRNSDVAVSNGGRICPIFADAKQHDL